MRSLRSDALALAFGLCSILVVSWWLFSGQRMQLFSAEQLPVETGFYGVEPLGEREGSVRWTAGQAQFSLPNPGGRPLVVLELSGAMAEPRYLQVAGALEVELALGPEVRRYQLLADEQPHEALTISFVVEPFQPAGDPRELGVVVRTVGIYGGGAAPAIVHGGSLLLSLVLYGLLRTSLRPWMAASGTGLFVIALLVGYSLRWPSLPFAAFATLGGLVLMVTLLGYRVTLPGWERWHTPSAPVAAAGQRPSGIIWLLCLALLVAYWGQSFWNQLYIHPDLTLDLGIYLEAGREILAGRNPYATFGLDELIIGVSFVYPPASLPVFAVLALLEPSHAERFWLLGNLVIYLIALLGIYAALPQQAPRWALVALLGLGFGFAPFWEHVAIGQINSLILMGMALFMLGQRNRAYGWVGDLSLALVILIKLTPGILLLWPLLRGDWMRLVRIGALLLLLCLPSLAIFGITPWQQFANIAPQLLAGTPRNPYNQALVAQLVVLTEHASSAERIALGLGRGFTLMLLGSWVLVAWRRRSHHDDGSALAYGVAVVTLASSLIWYHHLIFLAIPLAWLGFAAPTAWMRWSALLAIGLMQISRWLEFGLGLPPWSVVGGYLLMLGALGIWQTQTDKTSRVGA
ncbi:glycosyltransferase family 87 protein [Candidatus Viridilinea mediisalina]|uniref:DUF2029 domain-containing protein n=1 Tax=Candidatus Viridilinea mediisalina TaxID=2024553 RepID=A0A2A6RNG0_9CHLR|nr:glycosyltransferase family 87 protein [Candidatus Viridilinea mediisalina]PDW04634.1 hypothetical protein CJ255_02335 [Candidatus Viridilinea mediisalina]